MSQANWNQTIGEGSYLRAKRSASYFCFILRHYISQSTSSTGSAWHLWMSIKFTGDRSLTFCWPNKYSAAFVDAGVSAPFAGAWCADSAAALKPAVTLRWRHSLFGRMKNTSTGSNLRCLLQAPSTRTTGFGYELNSFWNLYRGPKMFDQVVLAGLPAPCCCGPVANPSPSHLTGAGTNRLGQQLVTHLEIKNLEMTHTKCSVYYAWSSYGTTKLLGTFKESFVSLSHEKCQGNFLCPLQWPLNFFE